MREGIPGLPVGDDLPELVLDAGSWRSWDGPPEKQPRKNEAYDKALARAALKAGRDEAVSTGEGAIAGHPVAVMAGNFGFLGGSIGRTAASRLVHCAEQATRRRMPLLAFPASGGTRMQEGAPGFTAALAVTAAVTRHRAARLPYLVYLRHPTFGGVLATWAGLGCPVLAEPGASIGFLGPRPYAALGGSGEPRTAQTAENLAAHDLIDAVVPRHGLRDVLVRLLGVLHPAGPAADQALPPSADGTAPARPRAARAAVDAWDAVTASRRADRPGLRDALRAGSVTWLAGDTSAGAAGSPLVLGAARIGRHRCVIVGQDRSAVRGRHLGPAALRRARRGMRLAEDLGLPLVTLIDTAGAELSVAAEEGGLAFEIGQCVETMLRLHVPAVAVLLGQGAGGGAIALAAADRLIALERSWLAPLAPEGASAIVRGHPGQAAELARDQQIVAADLLNWGIADLVLPEHDAFPEGIAAAVAAALDELSGLDGHALAERRYERFRRLAAPSPRPPEPAGGEAGGVPRQGASLPLGD